MVELVSILIPAYNAEQWITDTIDSALSQTWPKRELIIVDDGSTDDTLQLARKYESESVKVISQENRGASAARNRALEFAQGDYIQWLDADDLLAPDKISKQLRDSESGKSSLILLSSAFGEFHIRQQKAKFVPNALWQDLAPAEWLLIRFKENVWMSPAAWLVSRRLTELAGPWDERLSLDDDGEYFSRVVTVSEKIKFVPEAISYQRRASVRSLSRSRSDEACKSLLLSLGLCIGYLRSLEDSERTRAAAVKYLQTWLDYFYPEKEELLPIINDLARELGGGLHPYRLSWKYLVIKHLFGWKAAKQAKNIISNAKLSAHVACDKLMHKLSIR